MKSITIKYATFIIVFLLLLILFRPLIFGLFREKQPIVITTPTLVTSPMPAQSQQWISPDYIQFKKRLMRPRIYGNYIEDEEYGSKHFGKGWMAGSGGDNDDNGGLMGSGGSGSGGGGSGGGSSGGGGGNSGGGTIGTINSKPKPKPKTIKQKDKIIDAIDR